MELFLQVEKTETPQLATEIIMKKEQGALFFLLLIIRFKMDVLGVAYYPSPCYEHIFYKHEIFSARPAKCRWRENLQTTAEIQYTLSSQQLHPTS